MTREDEYGIDIGVFQQFRGLFRSLKLEGPLRRSQRPRPRWYLRIAGARPLMDCRFGKITLDGETAGTYAADPHFIRQGEAAVLRQPAAPLRYSGRAVVLQDRCVTGHSSDRRMLSPHPR